MRPDPARLPLFRRLAQGLSPLLRLLARKGRSDVFDPAEFLAFCCVGVANTLLDFCIYEAASRFIPLAAARTLSWLVAASFSYVLNKRRVFHDKEAGAAPAIRFMTVNVASLLLGIGVLELFSAWGCGRRTAYLATLPAAALGNYFGYKLWSFRGGRTGRS